MPRPDTRIRPPACVAGPICPLVIQWRCGQVAHLGIHAVINTTRRVTLIGLATFGAWLMPSGSAMPGGILTVSAQTVQLPTYRVFQMPLNVIVPDGGTAVVGGTSYSAASQSTRGLPLFGPGSRHGSFSRGANSVSVSATIIDHREWDAAILAEAARRRPPQPKSPDRLAAERMTRQIRPAPDQPVDEIAAAAQRHERHQQTREDAEALKLIRHGNQCLAKRQYGAARIFFRTAMRQSTGATHQLAQQRLTAIPR